MTSSTLLQRLSHAYHTYGIKGVLLAAVRRVTRPRVESYDLAEELVEGAIGFEIGGPSRIFDRGGLLPVYRVAQRIDNCNFAPATIWESDASDGDSFYFSPVKCPGHQSVAEATDLGAISGGSYDFVLCSHAIEHTANPLKALAECWRILKSKGALILVIPHKDGTFDHRRPVTTLGHLQEDFREDRGEDDLTHLSEVLAMHDRSRDPSPHTLSFTERMQRNLEFRSMHHHVFDTRLAIDLVEAAGFEVRTVEAVLPFHIIVVGQKVNSSTRHWAGSFRSPFPSDRRGMEAVGNYSRSE